MKSHKLESTNFFSIFNTGFWVLWSAGLVFLLLSEKGTMVHLFEDYRTAAITEYFMFFSMVGEEISYAILTILFVLIHWRYAISIPLIGGFVTLMAFLLKRTFNEPRPFQNYIDNGMVRCLEIFEYAQPHHGFSSFPSGHTMSGFALFSYLAFCWNKSLFQFICLFVATMVGLSRICLYNHYLEDILAGSLFGVLIGYTFYAITNRYFLKN